MKEFLPSFIDSFEMSSREIIISIPEFRSENGPAIKIQKKNFESATVEVHLWEKAYVSAVIVKEPTENLLSAQIIGGYDQDN